MTSTKSDSQNDTQQPSRRQNAPKRLAILLLAASVLALAASTAARAWLRHATAPRIYRTVADVPPEPVAVVLGAMVYHGKLSSVLQGRVDSAIALYKAGKVKKLLMTGDNGMLQYDEVTPMKRYAVEHGVPETDVVRDYAGFRTFDSAYRAKHVFRIDRAVFVTQDFHLPRAVYLARHVGIDAVGYVAPDNMAKSTLRSLQLRELGASFMAIVDAHNPWKRPRFPGPVEPPLGVDQPGR